MRRSEIAVFAVILGAAAVLRAAAAAAAFDPDLAFEKFLLLARQLIGAGWLAPEPFAYSPAYVYFIALLVRLGTGPAGICAVQVALGVGTCALVGALGRRLFGPAAGALAAAMAAAFGPFLLYTIEMESDGLGLFLYVAAALALLHALEVPSLGRFALAGVLLGLRAAQRPDALMLLALLAVLLAFGGRREAKRRDPADRSASGPPPLLTAAAYVGAAILPVLPITWQNARASGELIPVTSSGGWVFYTSQNAAATGLSYFPPALARALMEPPARATSSGSAATQGAAGAALDAAADAAAMEASLDRLDDRVSRRLAALASGRDLRPGEASRFWMREGMRSVERRGAARQGVLQVRKVFYMLHAYEAQDSLPLLAKEERLGRLALVGMGAIAPLALVGLVLALGTGARPTNVAPMAPRSRLLPMLAFLLVPVLSMSLFYVGARFRLELAAMLLPLAGLAIVRLGRLLRERRFSVLLAVAAGVVVLGVALHRPDGEIVRQRRMRLIQLHTFLAERAASRDVARAELRLATEAAVYPAEAEGAWRALGLLARESGDAEAAERAAGIASGVLDDATFSRLAGMRDDADAQWAVGRHLMLRGEKARAAEVLEEAARLSPDDPDVLLARAIAAMEAGTSPPDRVARWVEEAFDAGLRFSPNAATGHLLAARCYERLGDGGKAEAAAQEARRYLSDTSRSASRPG